MASAAVLWPPSHKMIAIDILGINDLQEDPVDIPITGVTQDGPVNGLGDGDTGPDAVLVDGRRRWANRRRRNCAP